MPIEIITSLISSIIGGLLVAIVNYFFTRNKTQAETEKLKAEADKFRAETEKVRTEIEGFRTTVEEANYLAPATSEIIIYDSTNGIEGYDVDGGVEFKNGTVVIQWLIRNFALRKYIYNGEEKNYLPKNELIAGERKIRVSCEAKITQGECRLIFMFSPHPEGKSLEIRYVRLNQTDWKKIDLYFGLPSGVDCFLKFFIDSLPGEMAENSSIQLRNLIVAEKQM